MLVLLFAIVLIPAIVVGSLAGTGPAATVGGLVALFSFVAFVGGSLRQDLRMAATLSPLLLVGAVVPRLAGEVSEAGGIALVLVMVFVAGLLPLRGPRFATAGLGLGMSTLFAYGFALTDDAGPWQLVVAAVIGVAIAAALRVLIGVADPSEPTRDKVAALLVDDEPDLGAAVETWLADGRPRWLGETIDAAYRYRLAGSVSRDRAAVLADRIRAKKAHPASFAGDALDAVETANAGRDTTPVPFASGRRHLLRPTLRLRSIQLQHAVRTTVGMLLTLLITAGLPAGDPLAVTALMTTFAILQASWRDTLAKARPRIAGLIAGATAVAVILLFVPASYLPFIAAASLVIGLWHIVERPAVGFAFMVMVSVGFNASFRGQDPVGTLIEYAALTVASVLIGVVIGFAVIPGLRPEPLPRRVRAAMAATDAVLRRVAERVGPGDAELLALQRIAAQTRQDLTPDHERLGADRLADLDQLRVTLRDVSMMATAPGSTGATGGSLLVTLVEQAHATERRLLAA